MGRKHANARRRFIPRDNELAIEFNPQARAVEGVHQAISALGDVDPIEFLYVWLVLCTLGILFLPSFVMILATL